jgi:hypothetical protein
VLDTLTRSMSGGAAAAANREIPRGGATSAMMSTRQINRFHERLEHPRWLSTRERLIIGGLFPWRTKLLPRTRGL